MQIPANSPILTSNPRRNGPRPSEYNESILIHATKDSRMATTTAARRWLSALFCLTFTIGVAAASAKPVGASTPISLWKVTDGPGHTLYLAGSMHALTQADMPLPKAYTRAFRSSTRLVEELDFKDLNPRAVTKQALAMGLLKGSNLATAMGKKDWAEVQRLAKKSGVALYHYERFKPWL